MTRAVFERRLDNLVRAHRFTIAVTVPLVGAMLLLASAWGWIPDPLAFHPLLILSGTAVMRLPLIAGLLPLVSRREAVFLGILSACTWGIEFIAIDTGYPYGSFEYGVSVGPMIAGIPVALPLFFVPLVLNAFLLLLIAVPPSTSWWQRVPLHVGLVIAIDLILDPAAVAIRFWSFESGGSFYGVPWTNFAGWVLSGTIAVLLVESTFPADAVRSRIQECDYILDDLLSFTLLWGTINVVVGNWIPVLTVVLFIGVIGAVGRLDLFSTRAYGDIDQGTRS